MDDVTQAQPHAVGSEKTVISGCLVDPERFIPVAVELGLSSGRFYLPSTRIVFELILSTFDAGEEVEIVAMLQKLIDKGKLDTIGGAAALTDLYSYAPGLSETRFRNHVSVIIGKWTLREVISLGNDAISYAYDNPDEPENALGLIEARLNNLQQDDNAAESTIKHARDEIKRIAEEFTAIVKGERKVKTGIATGFAELDDMTGGLCQGEVFVLAARPSVGKSALMMNIAENIAVDNQIPMLIFSAEMSRYALEERMAYGRARLSKDEVKGVDKGDMIRFQRSLQEIGQSALWIDDRARPSITEIRTKTRRMVKEHNVKAIAIDYLQLIKHPSPQSLHSREREVAEISGALKALAKELKIAVMVLAQLNRNVEQRSGKDPARPRMSDLRESGSLEQDADVVGLLYRDDYGKSDEEAEVVAGKTTLIIAKNRNGRTGDVPLTFIKTQCRFESGHPVTREHEASRQGRWS